MAYVKKKVRTTAERRRAAKNGWMHRRLRKASQPSGVLFMDEYPRASVADRKAAAKLILGKTPRSFAAADKAVKATNGHGNGSFDPEVLGHLRAVFSPELWESLSAYAKLVADSLRG